jgi:hypothetical protein
MPSWTSGFFSRACDSNINTYTYRWNFTLSNKNLSFQQDGVRFEFPSKIVFRRILTASSASGTECWGGAI